MSNKQNDDQREMMKEAAMEIGLTEEEAEDAVDVFGSDIEDYEDF